MKNTNTINYSFMGIIGSIEKWCTSTNDRSKITARYGFAWTLGILSVASLIGTYITLGIYGSPVFIWMTVCIVAPVAFYWVAKFLRWLFSD